MRLYDLRDLMLTCKYKGCTNNSSQIRASFRFVRLFRWFVECIFKPPPPVGAGGGDMFLGHPCVRPCVRPSVSDSRGNFMFPRYLQYLLTDFCQTFVAGASWDTDDLITFLGQEVKVQGHTIVAEAHRHSTRRYCRVQLFLVHSAVIFHCSLLRHVKRISYVYNLF